MWVLFCESLLCAFYPSQRIIIVVIVWWVLHSRSGVKPGREWAKGGSASGCLINCSPCLVSQCQLSLQDWKWPKILWCGVPRDLLGPLFISAAREDLEASLAATIIAHLNVDTELLHTEWGIKRGRRLHEARNYDASSMVALQSAELCMWPRLVSTGSGLSEFTAHSLFYFTLYFFTDIAAPFSFFSILF